MDRPGWPSSLLRIRLLSRGRIHGASAGASQGAGGEGRQPRLPRRQWKRPLHHRPYGRPGHNPSKLSQIDPFSASFIDFVCKNIFFFNRHHYTSRRIAYHHQSNAFIMLEVQSSEFLSLFPYLAANVEHIFPEMNYCWNINRDCNHRNTISLRFFLKKYLLK